MRAKPARGERRAALRGEHERRFRILIALKLPQRPRFVAEDGMGAGCALLDPTDRQGGVVEVDLVPSQVHQLTDPKAVAVGHKDHGGVAVAVPVALGCVDQLLDLGPGQVFPCPQFGVRPTPRRSNCSIFSGWCDQL
jgi:hypothetical protein